MRIGELATKTQVDIETIRFYEKAGLLSAPSRSDNDYRNYGLEHVEQLTFIRNCRALDMSLDEIRVLIQFRDVPSENCDLVNTLLDEHIQHVSDRLKQLRQLEKQLSSLRDLCRENTSAGQCQILKRLGESVESKKKTKKLHLAPVHGMKTTGR